MKQIKHIKIEKEMKVSEIVARMKETGFNARSLGEASEIFLEMLTDKDCMKFFGLAGALVPAGMKEIIIDMLQRDMINVLVSTGANLTHDLIEALGESHFQSDKKASEVNDAELRKQDFDRIYDVFMSNKVYSEMEKFFDKNYDKLKDYKSNKELLWKIGSLLPSGILKTCFEKKIPIFCPALSNSGIGLMLWSLRLKNKKIEIDEYIDLNEIIDLAWSSGKSGVFYIGGGEPKNYIQQAMQFSKAALYGIQITTENESYGGSSGALLREGISWGKLDEKARFVDVYCDATIALPLIYGYVIDKLSKI